MRRRESSGAWALAALLCFICVDATAADTHPDLNGTWDDGKGIDPKILQAGGQPGHFGIPGMRERAQRIGAHLDFWSEAGAGAEVELKIPASLAYQTARNEDRFRLFPWAGRDE